MLFDPRLRGLNYAALSGAAYGNSAESQQFFDRLITPPSGTRETVYANFIDGLVLDGVWAHLDALYVLCAVDEGTACTNLVQSSYQAQRFETTSTPFTFTADSGYSGYDTLNSLVTNFNPTTASSPKYTRNNAMVAVWVGEDVQRNANPIYDGDPPSTSPQTRMIPKLNDGKSYARINATSDVSQTYAGSTSECWVLQRTSSTAIALYRNNTSIVSSGANSSAALANAQLRSAYAGLVRMYAIGESLNSTERAALESRARTLITAIVGSTP